MIDAIPLLLAPEGYQISRSVRLRSSASAYLNRTNATPTSATTWTQSLWVKRGSNLGTQQNILGAGQSSGTSYSQLVFESGNALNIGESPSSGGGNWNLITTQVFRDPSAWYHIVLAYDSTQATASNRVKLYVNGLQVTAFSTAVYPTLNFASLYNTNAYIKAFGNIWYNGGPGGFYFDGYLTEINFIDGQALTPSSFGETNPITGVWQPKKYAGTYGTNGFYLNFSDNSNNTAATIGKDYSGNGNNWTPNNISISAGATYDSMLDVPTQWADGGNGRGNYATLNPLKNTASLASANLAAGTPGSAGYYTSYTTMSMNSGKYYWEISVVDDGVNSRYLGIGVADPSIALTGSATSAFTGTQAGHARGWTQTVRSAVSVAGTGLYNNSSIVNSTTRATTSGTRIFMVAYDADTGKCWMGYEGTWWTGDPAAGTSQYFTATAPMMPVVNPYNDGSIGSFAPNINFGQRPFSYTPPTGFRALNTQNLPTPTILKGNQYFDATMYTGNGSTQTVTNSGGFTPDLVWHKGRSVAYNHGLVDSVRGNSNVLFSNSTAAESNPGAQLDITTNGFISTYRAANLANNQNAATYVGWQWKEGPTQGFDIVTGTSTGATGTLTLAHNLGVAPSMVIAKNRDVSDNWYSWHQSLGASSGGFRIQLNITNAVAVSGGIWGTGHTDSNVLFGQNNWFTASGQRIVAYVFSEVAGFSRFGSYTGNNSADGPFVFCGFRPRFIMYKNSSAASQWILYDTAKNIANVSSNYLEPNTSDTENPSGLIDILSNGFKLRQIGTDHNDSGSVFIFAAFAENPFKNALAR